MGMFKGIEDQKVSSTRLDKDDVYFKPGKFIVELNRVFVKEKAAGGHSLIAECKVLESDNPAVPVGQTRSWTQSLQFKNVKHKAVVMKVIAEFFASVLGEVPEGGFNESVIEQLTGDDNPLAGRRVKINAYSKEVGDKVFTNYSFYAVK